MALGHVGRNDTNQVRSLRETLPKLRKRMLSSPLRQPHCFPACAKNVARLGFRVELRNTHNGESELCICGELRVGRLMGLSDTVGELLVSEELCPVMPDSFGKDACSR
jgi:hypothetical protein